MHNYSSLSSGSRYCKPEVISWWKVSITVFYTRFLSPTDQKCAESSVFWLLTVLLLLPTQYTAGEIFKMWCQEFDKYLLANIYIDIDITLLISDMDFLYQFNLRLHNFEGFFFQFWKKKKKIQKLAGLWLVGEVVNHVGLYGSKVAEGCSAFQHRSCLWSKKASVMAQSSLTALEPVIDISLSDECFVNLIGWLTAGGHKLGHWAENDDISEHSSNKHNGKV